MLWSCGAPVFYDKSTPLSGNHMVSIVKINCEIISIGHELVEDTGVIILGHFSINIQL